jgi:hypothetical protein
MLWLISAVFAIVRAKNGFAVTFSFSDGWIELSCAARTSDDENVITARPGIADSIPA